MAKAYVNGVGWIEKETNAITVSKNNDTYVILPSQGKLLSKVTVNVDIPEQEKSLDIMSDGTYSIFPDEGKVLSGVTVNVDTPDRKAEASLNVEITENGAQVHTPAEGTVFNRVSFNVNVPQGEGGIEGLDDRLDDIIALQESFIGDEPSDNEPELVPSMGLEIRAMPIGYCVAGIGNCTDTEIVIPSKYNDGVIGELPVIAIGDNAFRDNSNITKVVFNSNIEYMELMPFWGCSNCKVYDFSKATVIPQLDVTSFGGSDENDPFWVAYTFGNPEDLPEGTRFIVPDSLYDAWKTETNWCVYADYIYPKSAVPEVSPETTEQRLDMIEGNVEKVHSAGYSEGETKGIEQGYNEGYADGAMPFYHLTYYNNIFGGTNFPENYEGVFRFKELKRNDVSYMFNNVRYLKSAKLITDNKRTDAITANSMFAAAGNNEELALEVVDLTEFERKYNNINIIFQNQKYLRSVLGAIDLSECTNVGGAFNYCYALEDIEFVKETIKKSMSFSSCSLLTAKSTQSIIDGLATVDTTQTLTLHNSLKILQSQVDSANAKGWTVAGGTVVSEEEYYAE